MVNVTGLVTDTLVALLAGLVETRLNDPLTYVVAPVVNELLKVVTVLPSMSVRPLTDTLYTVEAVNAAVGTKVRVTPSLARVTVPGMLVLPCLSVMELLETVVGSTLLLTTALIWTLSGTPVCVLLGLIVTTVAEPVMALFPV